MINKKEFSFLKQNTSQLNRTMANLLFHCFGMIVVMVVLSVLGFFEFGATYTYILFFGGLFVCLMPKILIRFLPDTFMKYYMMVSVALFIGIIGIDKNIGIYITYALVPILSTLYFEPLFVLITSAFSYVIMIASLYGVSATMPEVLYQGFSRNRIFLAYSAGFTVEFIVVTVVLYYLVKQAKSLMLKYNNAEHELRIADDERQMLNALCVNFTAAFYCDLMTDYMKPIKMNEYSHSAQNRSSLNNPNSYSEWMNYSYENFIIKELSPDYIDTFNAQNLMRRLRTEESFVYPHKTFPNRVGMEYFEITVVRLYVDENSFKIIMGYRPIDDLVAQEREHQEQLENALMTAKCANESKTNFLHRMSHDIRTPLNGIIGLLKIDETHFDDQELVKENHKKMKVAANHLLSLINDVLQMSKLEDGHTELTHERISLFELTQDIVNIIIGRATDNGIKWKYEKGKSIIPYPYIYGSPVHLRQIFLNIYGNCIKYNHPNGTITTIVDTLEAQDGKCTYRWTISDTGKGMSQEFLAHIFEPFSQERSDARSTYEGTGLGMSIVKSLLDKMGGNIAITSEEGVGSTFVITIPFEIAPAPEKTVRADSDSANNIQGLHLMLAEDNELNAEIAQTLLIDAGAVVTVVNNGQQAVELFKDNQPGTFGAILMDVMMPVMDGLTATRTIRALDRDDAKTIPIIAMTANAFAEDARKCIAAGMNAHIAKPIDMSKLTKTLKNCLSR